MPKVIVISDHWTKVVDKPVRSAAADHRVDFDIDPRGHLWARIARGADDRVEIEYTEA